jgi:hypothetical protein
MSRVIALANHAANAGHPFFSFVIRDDPDTSSEARGSPQDLRQVYSSRNLGASFESGIALWTIPNTFDISASGPGFASGQGISLNFATVDNLTEFDFDSYVLDPTYPESLQATPVFSGYGHNSGVTEFRVLGKTDNFPRLRALTVWQIPRDYAPPTDSGSAIGSADVHPKGSIVGERSGSNEALDSLMRIYVDAWHYQRPQIGWSAVDSTNGGISFTTSKNQFRYIFDQSFGTGGSFGFSASGAAITLPLSYAAAGRRNQVRVYVFVYAKMSGTTDTGSIGVANKDSGGTMASTATALTNGATISGTTMQWYPDPASFDASTAPYFLGYAGSTPDRVALCAKSSGTTDSVKISAWTFIVQHSLA